MKKTLLLLICMVLGACDKDKSEYQTWTIASEKGVAGIFMGFGFVPANIIKEGPEEPWRVSTSPIEGFTFEQGYESVIRVRIDPIANPSINGSDRNYTMEKLISRTRKQSANKEYFNPEFELLIASERGVYYEFPCYWIKDLRYPDPQWNPLPVEIAGFNHEPGCEYRLRVKVSAERDASTLSGYGIQFTQLEELEKSQTVSEGLPAHP